MNLGDRRPHAVDPRNLKSAFDSQKARAVVQAYVDEIRLLYLRIENIFDVDHLLPQEIASHDNRHHLHYAVLNHYASGYVIPNA